MCIYAKVVVTPRTGQLPFGLLGIRSVVEKCTRSLELRYIVGVAN